MNICLNMIVRNEASNIERCLRSIAPVISSWLICDTGSTDGTLEIIERFFANLGIPGEIHNAPFVNFETTRNAALDAVRKAKWQFDYILLADADMELVIDDVRSLADLSAKSYVISQRNQIHYWNTRLLRRDAVARYSGVTHEFIQIAVSPVKLNGIWFIDHADGSNRPGKCDRDIKLLNESLQRDPQNCRSVFYLAQSQMDAGYIEDAINTYQRRVKMAGWDEEIWYSKLQIAKMEERRGSADTESAYLAAYDARPTRAEPLVNLARINREQHNWSKALLYARCAVHILWPEDVLFIDESSYTWRPLDEIAISAWYAGAFAEGKAASERLLGENKFPPSERQRIEENHAFYAIPRSQVA